MKITEKTVAEFHYTLKNEAGDIIETSSGQDSMAYLHGANNTLPGLEKSLSNKSAGDKFSVTLQPEEAYGEHEEGLEQRVSIKHLHGLVGQSAKWKKGMTAIVQSEQG